MIAIFALPVAQDWRCRLHQI
ncbi:MAG: hypothetical protein ACLR5N_09690 [Haemophilus parainfluenzae]